MGKVLIIDDDTDYSDMLSRQVKSFDHEVRVTHTLREGLSALADGDVEIVLLDVMLPDGNGLERARDIKASRSQPEIIIITGSGDEEGAELAIRAGAWDYWQKGRSAKGIVLTLRHALEFRQSRLARQSVRKLDLEGVVGTSPAMRACADFIGIAASSEAPVLLRGETGTGKEVIARAIHRNSGRAKKNFIVVDCASLTDTLMESCLFGHDRGAFTGASGDRVGLVKQANEGTLFLDEIGELPIASQKSFLRVLQEKRFRPVGSDKETTSDFRLIAATNRDLAKMVDAGTFREDLYFRLRSMEIKLPPLRERGPDSLEIAQAVLRRGSETKGEKPKELSPAFADALETYPWPGNVRELTHALECAVAAAGEAATLETIHLPTEIRVRLARANVKPELNLQRPQSPYVSYPTLPAAREAAVAAYLSKLIEDTQGDMDAACQLSDLSRSRLYELLKQHGITRLATGDEPSKKADSFASESGNTEKAKAAG
jgi:two-component system NtrC family response regulator